MNSLEKPIVNWYRKNKRDLPWRNTSPWGVMVSEFMLKQTPVNRVLPKWIEWMDRWPTPKSDLIRKSQSWNGTDRKCRGTIVQALRENESLTENAIKKLLPDVSQVEKAIKTLLDNHLFQSMYRNRYRLPQ